VALLATLAAGAHPIDPVANAAVTTRRDPAPTPPHPRFTNAPDLDLSGLIPVDVNGVPIEQPPTDEYAITPGDIGQAAFGELGARFQSLVIAFAREPRLSLYAMRVDPPPVTTADLEPHLATAGRYVGISGLARPVGTRRRRGPMVGPTVRRRHPAGHRVYTRRRRYVSS
jgi:hypothetical protein